MALEKNKRMTSAERSGLGDKLVKDYDKGHSLVELSQRHGTSAGRIRSILLERGVTLRPRGGAVRKPDPNRAARAKQLAKEYKAGASLSKLAATHQVSATTARNLVLAGGARLRSRGGQATTTR